MASAKMVSSSPADATRRGQPEPVGTAGSRFGARRPVLLAALLLAPWALAAATHGLGVDWLLLLLVVLGTASLLRAGNALVDRLVLAVGLLAAVVAPAGLLLSVWPWHLHPAVVGAAACSVLVAVGALTGRAPRLPRPSLRDLPVLVAVAAGASFMRFAYRNGTLADQVALPGLNDDYSRHFVFYDTIRLGGGYLFLRPDAAEQYAPPGYETYPQGSHFLYALVANFVESSAVPGPAEASFGLLTWCVAGAFVFLAVAVGWGMRWVAGPGLSRGATLAASTGVLGFVLLGPPIRIFEGGFTSQIAGLTLFTLLAAVAIRPIARIREHLVVLGALFVGISMTYYLYLPVAGALVVLSLWRYRRRLAAVRGFAWATAFVTVVLGLVEPVLNIEANTATVLLASGGIGHTPNRIVLVTTLLVGIPMLLAARRSPVWRAAGWAFGTAGVATGALWLYQQVAAGSTLYYYEKVLHSLLVVLLLSAGALALVVQRRLRAVTAGRRPLARNAIAVVTAVVVTASLTGLTANGLLDRPLPGVRFLSHSHSAKERGEIVEFVFRRHPQADGTITIAWISRGWKPPLTTAYLAALHRNARLATPARDWLTPPAGYGLDDLGDFLAQQPVPVRIVTNRPDVIEHLARLRVQEPWLRFEVDDVRPWVPPSTRRA
ncbi:MAG TPA: hypothetical protein VGR21_08150 [Cryptosporangiaceae bacterium]|nr:hypothetical protein [Cryptosporangiaceae bacterium]